MHRPFPFNCCLVAIAFSIFLASSQTSPAAALASGAPGFNSSVRPFLEEYCVRCHGPKKSKGKITVHTLEANFSAGPGLEHWQKILENLDDGEMPPEDEKQPDAQTRKAVSDWIRAGLKEQIAKGQQTTTAPSARRLTNIEYQNTLRDLLGVDIKITPLLLSDPVKPYRFNNTAEMMSVGPEQIDRYLEAARRMLAGAIVDPAPPEVHKTRAEWKRGDNSTFIGDDEVVPWGWGRGSPGGGMGLKSFPKNGEFRLRVKAAAILPKGVPAVDLRFIMGYNINENTSTLQIAPIAIRAVSANPDTPETFELRGRIENFPIQPGTGKRPGGMTITVQNLFNDGTLNDENQYLHWPRRASVPRGVIESMEFECPVADEWPPASHKAILFDSPLRKSDVRGYVREVIAKFLPRAYRRPVTPEEIEMYVKVYDIVSPEAASFEAAMRETLAMVLVSPKFLYHSQQATDAQGAQYEHASKLSYFLWGTMPDAELFDLAAKGQLLDEKVTTQQVHRMLADPRSAGFINSFTRQWLSIDKMKTVPINKDRFPRFLFYVPAGERANTEEPYYPTIRDYMMEETAGFVGEVIRRNESVTAFVDSKFAYLNEPLAAHYGIKGVQGIHLRPVAIKPEDKIGGLLTQGSVLIGNGTGTAPHPIYRAVWLREAILGDEVPAPPAEVPALVDSAGDTLEHAVTIKDLLALHRKQESCNDCHVRLDPWGIPFEQYNAIGQYQPMAPKPEVKIRGFDRAKDKDLDGYKRYLESTRTQKIDASSKVPHGPTVNTLDDLKAYLVKERQSDIGENFLRQLLQYSLGRRLSYQDRMQMEPLLTASKANGFKVQDMIVAICNSNLFRGNTPKTTAQK